MEQIDLDAIYEEAVEAYRSFEVVHFDEPWYIAELARYMEAYHD